MMDHSDSKLLKQGDIVANTDKPIGDDLSESDLSYLAAKWLLDKGYPIHDIDVYDLAKRIYDANYAHKDKE